MSLIHTPFVSQENPVGPLKTKSLSTSTITPQNAKPKGLKFASGSRLALQNRKNVLIQENSTTKKAIKSTPLKSKNVQQTKYKIYPEIEQMYCVEEEDGEDFYLNILPIPERPSKSTRKWLDAPTYEPLLYPQFDQDVDLPMLDSDFDFTSSTHAVCEKDLYINEPLVDIPDFDDDF